MPYKQMFFVQVFGLDSKNRIVGGRSYTVHDETAARAKAEYLSEKVSGVVAFSQMIDDKASDAEEPVLLAFYGRVPPEARTDAA